MLAAAAEQEAAGEMEADSFHSAWDYIRNWSEGISVMEEEKHFQCDGGQMLEQGNKRLWNLHLWRY